LTEGLFSFAADEPIAILLIFQLSTNEKGRLEPPEYHSEGSEKSGISNQLLLNLALQNAGALGQIGLGSLDKKGIKTTTVLDASERSSGNPQTDRTLQSVGLKRDIAEVRQELPLGLTVRVAHEVATQHGFAGQFATARHRFFILLLLGRGRNATGSLRS